MLLKYLRVIAITSIWVMNENLECIFIILLLLIASNLQLHYMYVYRCKYCFSNLNFHFNYHYNLCKHIGHRPTFYPAIGKNVFGSSTQHIISIKDQLGHKVLKFRQFGQSTQQEIYSRDYKAELEEKEEEHLKEKNKDVLRIGSYTTSKPEKNTGESQKLITNVSSVSHEELKKKYDDADVNNGDSDKDLDSR